MGEYINFQFFQKFEDNRTNTVKISNLPIIIVNAKIHLAALSNEEQLPDGPIISPNPGPTFEIADAAAEKALKKSRFRVPRIDGEIQVGKINHVVKVPSDFCVT